MKISILEGEALHPVVRAVELATCHRPHKSKVYRWMSHGTRGVRMPYLMLGGQRVCSVECVRRWINEVTRICNGSIPNSLDSGTEERNVTRANRDLADNGW